MLIPIFKDDPTSGGHQLVKLPHDYNSRITLNNPADDDDDTYQIETVGVDISWDSFVEPSADIDGIEAGAPRRVQAIYHINGWVRAPSIAKLHDKINALNEAFDPVLTYMDDTATVNPGYMPYNFSVPTADTDNYATGLIPVRIYVASIRLPVGVSTKFDGYSAKFALTLRALDPRAYLQTTSSGTRTGNGTVNLVNTLATYPSWPTILLEFTTAPSSDITITQNGVTITIDYTKIGSHTSLEINTSARDAKFEDDSNGMIAIKSTSRFWPVYHGTTGVVTLAGAPADCDLTITWRRAFA